MIEKMVSGLPDYTKYVTPQVTVVEAERPFGTKAETVDKKTAYAHGTDGAATLNLKASIGYYIGLILLVATTDGAGATLRVDTWLGDTNVTLWTGIQVPSTAPLVLIMPCFIPDQDLGDGVNNNIIIYLNGSCGEKVNIMAIYFEEEGS